MSNFFILSACLYLVSVLIASFSQIILKKSANKKDHRNITSEYLNKYVISAYGILVVSTVLTAIAYRGVNLSQGLVFESFSFIFIAVLSKIFLKEKITKNKVIGISLIVVGVIIFTVF